MRKTVHLRSTLTACGLAAATLAMVGCTTTGTTTGQGSAPASRAQLESQATAALDRLYVAAPGTRELVARSTAVLVCPAVIRGSFVVGFERGDCVMRANGSSRGYYTTTGASFGWQAGGQSRSVIYVFNTPSAYHHFVSSNGWSAGVDASVAAGRFGANGSIDTGTAQAPISSFVLTNAGLELGASVQGNKITPATW